MRHNALHFNHVSVTFCWIFPSIANKFSRSRDPNVAHVAHAARVTRCEFKKKKMGIPTSVQSPPPRFSC